MTEREKMTKSMKYNPGDPELAEARIRVKRLCKEYSEIDVADRENRLKLMKQIINVKEFCYIEAPFMCDYGFNITVGKYFYANHGCIILDGSSVTIGDEVMFGPYVQLYTASHPLNAEERCNGTEYAFPITIGNRVWLGGGVIVCPGVTIGDGTTIGSGSVVTKDIPPNVFAAGNPCKVIKEL